MNAEQKRTTWGGHQVNLVEFLQRNLPKCSLAELSAKEIEHHIDILRLRPLSQEGKQISVSWAKSCIKQYRNFLKWLNRSEDFSWKRPADLEFDQVRIPLTPQEKSITARTAQVKTFTLEELKAPVGIRQSVSAIADAVGLKLWLRSSGNCLSRNG